MKTLIFTLIALLPLAAQAQEYHACIVVPELEGVRQDTDTLEIETDRISMATTIRANLQTGATEVSGWNNGDCAAILFADGLTVFCTGGNATSLSTEAWRVKDGKVSLLKGRHTSGMFGSAHSLFSGVAGLCE